MLILFKLHIGVKTEGILGNFKIKQNGSMVKKFKNYNLICLRFGA